MYDNFRVQWTMTVTIYHGPKFGHAIEVVTETAGRPSFHTHDTIGTWTGVGCPLEIVKEGQAALGAIFAGHILDRYGVAEQLSGWPVEGDPM